MKVCVFVDGENFRHAICDLFSKDGFSKNDYLPKNAKWADFFNWIVDQSAGDSGYRIRTYWYVIDLLDFYPYILPTAESDKSSLLKSLSMDMTIKDELGRLQEPELTNKVIAHRKELKDREKVFSSRFDGWKTIQNGISTKHDSIEFRRAGAIKYDLFEKKLGQEKAVDVKLATDLIVLKDIYDVAVIVSGDQDYVPAVQHIKDHGKKVVNVSFRTINGRLLPGGAKRLNIITDKSLEIAYKDLKDYLQI